MSEILFLYPLGWRAIVRAELKRVEFANSSIEFFLIISRLYLETSKQQ